MNRCPTGVRSRSIRSRWSLRLSESPATNAPMIGASFAASASSAKNSVNASASATNVPAEREWRLHHTEQRRTEAATEVRREHQEPDRHRHDGEHGQQRDGALGDDAHDDGEDHQPEHVVGHRGAEHSARLDRRERAEVAEDPRGDPDARRRERGAEEQRRVRVVRERDADPEADRHRQGDADHGDAHRRPPDRGEVADVHLHPDLQQEEDHAELGEHLEDLRGADQPEDRRPDDDARDDLADHRRHPDALRDLRRELRRDQQDQDVPEDLDDGQRHLRGRDLEEVAPGADGPDLETERRDPPAEPEDVHVEGVARRRAGRPGPAGHQLPPDHRPEPLDQRPRELALHRRERDPTVAVAQEAVTVERELAGALVERLGAVVGRELMARRAWPSGAPTRNALDVAVSDCADDRDFFFFFFFFFFLCT